MNRLICFAILLSILATSGVGSAQYEGMKYRIPQDTNMLVLIDLHKMFGSPVANRERWMARRKAAFDAGMIATPPGAEAVILAARTDLEYHKTVHELGMMKMHNDYNVTEVAARYGGSMDNIEGRAATRLPDDTYVVQLMDNLLAHATPANRQDVARWLRSTDVGASSKLPDYLEKAFSYAKDFGTPIVMAVDVGGHIAEHQVKQKMTSMESLKDVDLPVDSFAKLIAGARGMTLGITVGDKTVGAIRVDFSEPPTLLSEVGKPLLLEVLRNNGGYIDDLENWQPSIQGNSFMLRGTFSLNGMRRVMSVLELPPSLTDAMLEATSPGADPEGKAKLLASQAYFTQITTLLDDLRGKPKRDHVKTFGQAAIWYDKYARKIDRMSILNVDEMLVDYGANMAAMLRQGEMTMKGVGMRTSVRTRSNQPSSSGYGMAVGGYRAGMGYNGGMYGVPSTYVGVNPMTASLQAKGQSDAIIRTKSAPRVLRTSSNCGIKSMNKQRPSGGKWSASIALTFNQKIRRRNKDAD
ncbi:hypothetical protein [Novipirellula maiorica]|nr:hypothetical protein [Rhodopirellula maiorica]